MFIRLVIYSLVLLHLAYRASPLQTYFGQFILIPVGLQYFKLLGFHQSPQLHFLLPKVDLHHQFVRQYPPIRVVHSLRPVLLPFINQFLILLLLPRPPKLPLISQQSLLLASKEPLLLKLQVHPVYYHQLHQQVALVAQYQQVLIIRLQVLPLMVHLAYSRRISKNQNLKLFRNLSLDKILTGLRRTILLFMIFKWLAIRSYYQ